MKIISLKNMLDIKCIFGKVCIVLILPFILCANAYGVTDVYLGLKKTGAEKIRIAVAELKAKVEAHRIEYISKESSNILMNDLTLTGIFEVIENKNFVKEIERIDKREGKIVFAEWSRIGAQALIKAEYLFSRGKLVVDLKLYDIYETKLLLNKRYSTKVRGLRNVMHKFCDDIVLFVTGERGVASTKITFASFYSGYKEIYIMDYDGYNLTRLTREKSIALSPEWSPDGKYIVFTTYKYNNPDIYTIKIKNRTKWALSKREGLNTTPAWSPDGRYIAMTLSKDKNSEIYTMKTDGSELKRLTHNRAIDTSPSWSPDGKKIAFTSDRSGRSQIYIMNSNGTGLKRITYSGKENQSPDWSPKGDKIAYSSRQNRYFDIYIIDTSGNNPVQLTNNMRNNENPSWSPDGRHIVFESINNKGKHKIYTMLADGRDQHIVLSLKGGGYNPSWSPRFD